jgi:Lrp/AsnC family transcriptional regulator for asnA, asnC and gidA
MDEIDANIIKALKKDSRTSFVKIGKELGLTEGAIRQRVAKLCKSGAIKKFTIEATTNIKAIILIGTSSQTPTSKVAKDIRKFGIENVYEVSGNYDIICLVEGESLDEINSTIESIRNLDGVVDTTTTMVLK